MASKTGRHLRDMTLVLSDGRGRATRRFAGAAVVAASLLGTALPASAATPPTLAVVVLGSGGVVSKPAGIACPGTCTASFAPGTRVILTPEPKDGSKFLGWGGSCTGSGACTVKVSTLTAVAGEFAAGVKTKTQTLPPRTKSVAIPGYYSGSYANNNLAGLDFFVLPGGTTLTNISVSDVVIGCVPAGSIPSNDHLGILDTPINRNGSFAATSSQEGVFDNAPAKFTYSFVGRFMPATAGGEPTAAGTFRENIAFLASGTSERCTSNTQSWTTTHGPQAAPTKSVVVPGYYSGLYANNNGAGLDFFVSPGARTLTNISVPGVALACTPAGSFPSSDHLSILDTPIRPDGSFAATATQEGVFDNATAKFTYSFAGYFEGPSANGTQTVAGTFREDIVFPANGTTETCTSDDQSWTMTYGSLATPASSVARPGSYLGYYADNNGAGVTFSVSPGGRTLTNISVGNVALACTPAGSFPSSDHLSILDTPIRPDGSFAATTSQEGDFDNATAKFTYSFAGYVEGTNYRGKPTVAGTFREDIVFPANGTTETCTSDLQSWTATGSS